MKNSKKGKVDWYDLLKSLIMTSGTALFSALIPIVKLGRFPTHDEIKLIIGAAIAAGLFYLFKQFNTNSKGQLLRKEE